MTPATPTEARPAIPRTLLTAKTMEVAMPHFLNRTAALFSGTDAAGVLGVGISGPAGEVFA